MKIATFNVNDMNKRLANLLDWLRQVKPDVACLQELKATDAAFPTAAIERAGYRAVWRGEKSWNGVAILARGCEPVLTRTALPGDTEDKQSRYIEAAVRGVLIATLYAPNGNPQPQKFQYKLAWMKRLLKHAAELYALDAPVVLAGDFNVAPTDADIYPTKSYAKNALVQPEPRALFQKLLDQEWVDAIRALQPDQPMYTFWDYKRNRWERDAGLRIDHLLLNRQAAKRLVDAGVDREVRGRQGASDHAPAWIELSEKSTTRRKQGRSEKPARPKKKLASAREAPRRPLLVIDGDSFAHRSYHACQRQSDAVGTNRPAPSSASPTCCFGCIVKSNHARCWLPGIHSKPLRTGMSSFPPIRAAASSTTRSSSSSRRSRNLWAPAGSECEGTGRRGGRFTRHRCCKGGEARRHGLRGDPSDKVPGAPGVGTVGAATLLQRYQSSNLSEALGCVRDEKGGIVTDPVTEESSVPGVYVAGDASRDVCSPSQLRKVPRREWRSIERY